MLLFLFLETDLFIELPGIGSTLFRFNKSIVKIKYRSVNTRTLYNTKNS